MNRKPPSRKPSSRLSRRLLVGAVLLLAALAAGHALLWRAMASGLEEGWQAWAQLRRAQGWRVDHAPPVTGGWPFAATLTLDRVRLEGAAATLPGGMALAAERVVLRVALPRLDRLEVSLPAQQRLRLGDVEFPFTADSLVALVPLERDTPPSEAEVTADRLRIGTPAGGVELRGARLSLQGSSTATEEEPAFELRFAAEGVQLPPAPPGSVAARFGRVIESLAADLALSGPLPPRQAPAARAEAWRDAGGTLELRGATLRWGPLAASGAATLALDEQLQPMGAGTLRLAGAAETLEAMAEAGLLTRRAALTARTVVPLLSRPNAETGQPEIEVPLVLEDRTLTLARIPVVRFAPLDWPGR